MNPSILDTVKLRIPLPDYNLEAGDIGVIVSIFDSPDEAYEVEFTDDDGKTVAQPVLRREDFHLV